MFNQLRHFPGWYIQAWAKALEFWRQICGTTEQAAEKGGLRGKSAVAGAKAHTFHGLIGLTEVRPLLQSPLH
jgi:hypothetical protein